MDTHRERRDLGSLHRWSLLLQCPRKVCLLAFNLADLTLEKTDACLQRYKSIVGGTWLCRAVVEDV